MIITPAEFEDKVETFKDERPDIVLTRSYKLMVDVLSSLGYDAGLQKISSAMAKKD